MQDTDAAPTAPALWAFCVAIFTGAFLLFQVQPLIGKYILPWFGGGPGVWTTCLVFFQCLLFAGYAYAHFLNHKLAPDRQAIVHLVMLAAALLLANITPGDSWKPSPGEAPEGKILALLAVCVGLPYLVLASTGPLIQAWFARAHKGRSPYRLYALSNVGSLLALLSFPFIVEPNLTRDQQMGAWSNLLRGFLVLYAFITWRMRALALQAKAASIENEASEEEPDADPAPTPVMHRLLWLLLPAIGTVLLMSTTNLICQEIAVIPFLWVVPLALYLLTFIIAFDSPRWYWRPLFGAGFFIAAAASCYALKKGVDLEIQWQLAAYIGALFFGCMICHGELFRLRPPSQRLTGYYLCISGGGALGGLFVSLAAPVLFQDFFWEFHLGLLACAVAGVCLWMVDRWSHGWPWRIGFGGPLLVLVVYLGWQLNVHRNDMTGGALYSKRNFYGLLKVFQGRSRFNDNLQDFTSDLQLVHGRILHGSQFADPKLSQRRISYFADDAGIGLAMRHVRGDDPKRVGVLGLGVGAAAAYARQGDQFRFYEINPAVKDTAENIFTYLQGARDRNATVDVVIGDGRLMLEAEPDTVRYDVLSMDAFSSDSVPVHLLTTEAFAIYEKHLSPNGVIVINITNRYLNLEPVVRRIAEARGLHFAVIHYWPDASRPWLSDTTYVLLSPSKKFFEQTAIRHATLAHHAPFADQFEQWLQSAGPGIKDAQGRLVGKVLDELITQETDPVRKKLMEHARELAASYYVDNMYYEEYKVGALLERRKPRLKVKLWTDDYSSLFPILK